MESQTPLPSTTSPLHLTAKRSLTPSSDLFLDYTPPSPPPPPPPPFVPAPPTPSSTAASKHDYFSWLSNPPPTPLHDISTPAPSSPNSYLHPTHDSSLGAWYSFANGLQSEVGSTVYADQLDVSNRMKATLRRARQVSRPYQWWDQTEADTDEDEDDSIQSLMSSASYKRRSIASVNLERTHNVTDVPHCVVSPNSDDDHTYEQGNGEVTAEMAANGVDVQGIPWDRLPFSREDYRATRMRETSRRESSDFIQNSSDLVNEPRRGAMFYQFFRNTRKVRCSIVHFQLRNLAWATSKHDVFVMHDATIVHWDAAARRKTQVLDLSGSGSAMASGLVQISTMIAKDDLVIAGGFYGEMIAKNLKTNAIIHNKRITYDENAITNAIDIFERTIMTSNNDCFVRCFDMETFEKKSSFEFHKPVNHATRQPDGKMVAVAGDDKPVQVIDGESGERIAQLHGHKDFSFATGWHPDGRMFATGSQDRTCRVWDIRNMSRAIRILGAHVGAVRSLRFSSCGRFLAMAEPRDFVHIFDVSRGEFDTCQEIDLFGEIAGIALTPSAEGLYIAVNDRTYSSLLEYERRTSGLTSEMII